MAIQPGHVHLLITGTSNKIIQQAEGYTSRTRRDESDFGLPSLWTRSCFVSSAGEVSSQTIERYPSTDRTIAMQREVTTTVRVKRHSLTQPKARVVEGEYSAFQDAVHGDATLYSATKQQAGSVRSDKNPREGIEQPVVLRNDCVSIEHDEHTVPLS